MVWLEDQKLEFYSSAILTGVQYAAQRFRQLVSTGSVQHRLRKGILNCHNALLKQGVHDSVPNTLTIVSYTNGDTLNKCGI